jgi:hypothetical protein
MGLTISDDSITGDHTAHTARRVPGQQYAWEVSWLPERLMDRNAAITAMMLADIASSATDHDQHRLWPHVEGWAGELGLTAPEALARVSEPPGRTSAEKDGAEQSDPEAAG